MGLYTLFKARKLSYDEVKLIEDMAAHRVHDWYAGKLKALKEWAREVCKAVFNCLANGRASFDDNVSYERNIVLKEHAINELKQRAVELEEENKVLREKLRKAYLPGYRSGSVQPHARGNHQRPVLQPVWYYKVMYVNPKIPEPVKPALKPVSPSTTVYKSPIF